MDAKQIVQRLGQLRTNRTKIEAKWEEIDRYILPLRQGDFAQTITQETSKDWSTVDVWDSTAPIGAERLIAMLHASLLSGRWFGAKFRRTKANQDPKARKALDDRIDMTFDALESSNFDLEMVSGITDWVGYGNGALKHAATDDLVWKGMDFGCVALRELFFEDDWRGLPYRAFLPLSWTATQIISKFKKEDGSLPPGFPEKLKKMDETGDETKHEVIYAVYPRDGAKPMGSEKSRAPELRPWATKYVLTEGLFVLEEGGLYDFPLYVLPWMKSATSQWGYGPSLLSLPTVKLVNSLEETYVNSGAKAVDPVTLVTERGLLTDLDHSPGGLVTVRSLDDIDVLESKARFDVSDALLADHRMMLRKHYREDDIGLRDSPAMTATEVNRRFVQSNRNLSPQTTYWKKRLAGPVVQATYNMLYRAGEFDKLDPLPPGEPVQIQFFGPLMTAMRDDEVANIERLITAKSAMVKMDPGSRAKHVLKDDAAMREMAERLSTPASMLASDQEVEEAVAQEQQMAAQAMQAQTMKSAAEADRAKAGADQMRQEAEA